MAALPLPCLERSAEDAAKRERLILAHMPQVRWIARNLHVSLPPGLSYEDLVSAGTIGLIKAADSFRPEYNVRLYTYASFRIRGEMLDSIRSMGVQKPEGAERRIRHATATLEQRLQRHAREEEIATEAGISLREMQRLKLRSQHIRVRSLDAGGPGSEEHKLADRGENCPEKAFERSELRRLLSKSISLLPRRERIVLTLCFAAGVSVTNTGRILGRNGSRVSQIKSDALRRLRSRLAPAGYRGSIR